MTLYSFYIFDRHCRCVYSREYTQSSDGGSTNHSNESDTAKLMFGMLYSLKNIASKLGDKEARNNLKSLSTGKFRLHLFETASGLRFVIVLDPAIDNLQSVLWELYSNYYVRNVALNALLPVDFASDELLANPKFVLETDRFLVSLPVFR